MTDDPRDDPEFEAAWQLFKKARPQFAHRQIFDFGDDDLKGAFEQWNSELQAEVDRLIPGLPQDLDRAAVLEGGN